MDPDTLPVTLMPLAAHLLAIRAERPAPVLAAALQRICGPEARIRRQTLHTPDGTFDGFAVTSLRARGTRIAPSAAALRRARDLLADTEPPRTRR